MTAEQKEFLEFITKQRDQFVIKFWDMYPNAKQRVIAEDLLIAYDQMREILEEFYGKKYDEEYEDRQREADREVNFMEEE